MVNILNELIILGIYIIKGALKRLIIDALFEVKDLFILNMWMVIKDSLYFILNLVILLDKLRWFYNRKFIPEIRLIF